MAATQRKLKEAVNAGDFAIIQLYSGEEGCDYHTGNHFFKITTKVDGYDKCL